MKHNIIYVIDGLSMGGAERLMIPMLKHLNKAEFEPRVCFLQEKEGSPLAEDLRHLGIPVDHVPVRHLRDLSGISRLARYFRDAHADLVHTQLEFSNIYGNIAAKLLHLPSVCTIHVLPSSERRLKSRMHQRLEALALRSFCDRVIAVSEEARQSHIAAAGASPAQVVTLYNGIELGAFANVDRHAERDAVRGELGIPDGAMVLTTVAVLRHDKGIQYMIRALPSILRAHPDACYLVVGGGSYGAELHAEVAGQSLNSSVIFTGMRSDIPRIMAASDVFVLPTLTEALPTVLMEAMAAHLPIVASAVGGVPEMLSNGENGRLVPAKDVAALAQACNDVLSSVTSRVGMAETGWQIVNEKFNIERQVERLQQLYLDEMKRYGK